MNDPEQEFGVRSIRIEVYGVSIIFQDPTTQSTDTLEFWMTSIFESLHHLRGCRVPFSFRCLQDRENVQCPCETIFAFSSTFSEFEIQNSTISFSYPIDVVEHWHENDSVCEFFRFDVPFSQINLDLLRNLQWRKSRENIPLEFNCFSVVSLQFFVRREHLEFFHLTFPSYNCIVAIIHFPQA